MPDNQSIEVTGLFGFIPCFGVHILLADKGRFYIAHIPETAHLYVGYRVAVTGLNPAQQPARLSADPESKQDREYSWG